MCVIWEFSNNFCNMLLTRFRKISSYLTLICHSQSYRKYIVWTNKFHESHEISITKAKLFEIRCVKNNIEGQYYQVFVCIAGMIQDSLILET